MSVFDRLSLNEKICRPFQARFTAKAKYGYYLFTKASTEEIPGIKTTENTGVYDAGLLQPNIGLYIERIAFAATCSDYLFSNAVDASFNPAGISLNFSTSGNNAPATRKPISFASFNDYTPIETLITTQRPNANPNDRNNKDETLIVSIYGRLKQTPELLSANFEEISILVSVVATEILNINEARKQYSGK